MGPVASVVIPAAISAVGSLFGAKKGADAAKDSSRIQASTADKALAAAREARDQERAEIERVRAARAGIFERWEQTNPLPTSRGNLPNSYGISDAQTAQMRQGNGAQGEMPPPPPGGPPPSGQAGAMPPPPPGGVSASLGQAGPTMPPPNAFGQTAPPQGAPAPYQNATPAAPAGATMSPPGGVTGSANASTVWLQAPTGETMEIPIEPRSRVQKMVSMGAMIIAKPAGAFGQQGVSYGNMV